VHVTVTMATEVMHHATRTRSDQHVEPIIYSPHSIAPLLTLTYKFIHLVPATHTTTDTHTDNDDRLLCVLLKLGSFFTKRASETAAA